MQATIQLLDATLAAAVAAQTTTPVAMPIGRVEALAVHATFAYGSNGTSAKAWLQTSLDGGVSWMDIANFAFTTSAAKRCYNLTAVAVTSIATPVDGSLSDNTAVNGFLGALFRVKLTTTGTYAGASSLKIWVTPK